MTDTRDRLARSDYGTGERLQHGSVILEETMRAGVKRARNTSETILDVYLRQGRLAKDKSRAHALYDAGIRLRADWLVAGLEPRVTSRYSDLISEGCIQSFSGYRIDAYNDWQKAIEKVGQEFSDTVINVCCLGEKVGRGNMEPLRCGLARLAVGYGYIKATGF